MCTDCDYHPLLPGEKLKEYGEQLRLLAGKAPKWFSRGEFVVDNRPLWKSKHYLPVVRLSLLCLSTCFVPKVSFAIYFGIVHAIHSAVYHLLPETYLLSTQAC